MYVQEEENFVISSDPQNGAFNRNSLGSYFEIKMDEPLTIPQDAKNINVNVEEMDVWFVTPNISGNLSNNLLYILGPDTNDIITQYTVTLPKGLYDLASIQSEIEHQLTQFGAKSVDGPLMVLNGNSSTNKVYLTLTYTNTSIDFTQPNTIRTVLGFVSSILTSTSNLEVFIGSDIARLNNTNFYMLQSEMVTTGLRVNGQKGGIIAKVPIDVNPGSQVLYSPNHPPKIGIQHLAGSRKKKFRFSLLNSEGDLVDTNGEYFSFRLSIRYFVKIE